MPSHDDCVHELRDGSRVVVRPIAPDDRAALAAGFARLSPESRFRRFLSPKKDLIEQELDVLTRVDHHDHEALVALDADTGEGLGVARFVRTGPDRAEPAVVVAEDPHVQRDAARSNARAIGLLEALGETSVSRVGADLVVDVPVPPPGADERLIALLREVARAGLARSAGCSIAIERIARGHRAA